MESANGVGRGCGALINCEIVEFGLQSCEGVEDVHHGFVFLRWHRLSVLAGYIQPTAKAAFGPLFVALAFPIATCLAGLGCDSGPLATL